MNKTSESTQLFAEILYKINFCIILTFGVLGNVCSIYVYLQKSMRKRKFNWYLLVLACFEIFFNMLLSVDYLYKMLNENSIFLHDINVYTNMLIDYLIHLIDSYVTIITLILSIDRLNAIKNLATQRNLITYQHAKFLIFLTFLIIFLLKIPVLILCYENTERYLNVVSCMILSPLLFNLLPTIAILVINSLLVCRLIKFYRKLKRERTSMLALRQESRGESELDLQICRKNSNENIEVNVYSLTQKPLCRTQKAQFAVIIVTGMWSVLITLIYYPLSIFHLYLNRINIDNHVDNLTKIQIISSTFFNLNHCIHFFIYFFFNFEFRKCLLKVFRKK
jgi:hypothetical protein